MCEIEVGRNSLGINTGTVLYHFNAFVLIHIVIQDIQHLTHQEISHLATVEHSVHLSVCTIHCGNHYQYSAVAFALPLQIL
jgi:hypothetical protein